MRLFKTPSFQKEKDQSDLEDEQLVQALDEVASGLVDAQFGTELIKKRVACKGKGKSGGYLTIIAFRQAERAIFLHLVAKSEKANTSKQELAALKTLARHYMKMSPAELDAAVTSQALVEIRHVKDS
jgi:hypothetical protein